MNSNDARFQPYVSAPGRVTRKKDEGLSTFTKFELALGSIAAILVIVLIIEEKAF
jgi:hypothetical protein